MSILKKLRVLPFVMLPLAGCNDALDTVVANKVEHPLPAKLVEKMRAYDMSTRAPIMMRIFKEEGVLEVWKAKGNQRFEKITEYEICKWSGKLGPKIKEGDRQAPEGYYRIYKHQMNPNSSYYLSFNMGYPNSYDRSHGRTGSNLMVHGACSSAGCYSMTDEQVLEIYAFAREAFRGGQEYFTVAAYPFRMTPENMARHRDNPHFEFWKMLKTGYDQFEITKRPPKVEVCEKRYVFNQQTDDPNASFNASGACPAMQTPASLASAFAAYQQSWNQAFAKAVADEEKKAARQAEIEIAKAEAEARRKEEQARREAEEAERAAKIASGEIVPGPPAPIKNLFSFANRTIGEVEQVVQGAPAPDASTAVADPAPSTQSAQTEAAPAAQPAADGIPVPTTNPLKPESVAEAAPAPQGRKPFWKVWGSN